MLETARGRWFLGEYAKRNRSADYRRAAQAIGRLENAVVGERGPSDDGAPALRLSSRWRRRSAGPSPRSRRSTRPTRTRASSRPRPRRWTASCDHRARHLRHPPGRRGGAGGRLDLRETGADSQVCDRSRPERDPDLHRLLVPGPDRAAHQPHRQHPALSRATPDRDDRDLGQRGRPPVPAAQRSEMPATALDQDDVDQIVATGKDRTTPRAWTRNRSRARGCAWSAGDPRRRHRLRAGPRAVAAEPAVIADEAMALEDAFAEIDDLALDEKLARFT